MKLTNIRAYRPEVRPFGNVQYYCDEEGRDFYEFNKGFSKSFVVQTNGKGLVKAVVTPDRVPFLCPSDTTLEDVDSLPEGFSLKSAYWTFIDGVWEQHKLDPTVPTSYRKKEILSKLTLAIAPYQDVIDEGEATPEEEAIYKNIKSLRIKLMRIPDSQPPGEVKWDDFTI